MSDNINENAQGDFMDLPDLVLVRMLVEQPGRANQLQLQHNETHAESSLASIEIAHSVLNTDQDALQAWTAALMDGVMSFHANPERHASWIRSLLLQPRDIE